MHPNDPVERGGRLSEASPALGIAGTLMVAAGLLLANPFFGVADSRWPWQILAAEPTRINSANWMLWFLTGLAALGLGVTDTRRLRAPLLLGLTLVLAVTCHSQVAGLVVVSNGLAFFAGAAALLAGFQLGADGRSPRSALLYALLGALLVLWALAASFGDLGSGRTGSSLVVLVEDFVTRVRLGSVPDAVPNYDDLLWSYASILGASALGLLGLLGLRGSLISRMGIALVLLCFLVPTFSGLGRDLSASFDLARVAGRASEVLIGAGLALTLLAAATLADLARLGGSEPQAVAPRAKERFL